MKAIKQHEGISEVEDMYWECGISNGTLQTQLSKCAGMEVNKAKRLRELESENVGLKQLLADKVLEVEAMKDLLSKEL